MGDRDVAQCVAMAQKKRWILPIISMIITQTQFADNFEGCAVI